MRATQRQLDSLVTPLREQRRRAIDFERLFAEELAAVHSDHAASARNLLHYLGLRLEKHAQQEIRSYAENIAQIVASWVPMTWGAFNDYHPRRRARTFSRMEMEALREMVKLAQAYLDPHTNLIETLKPELIKVGMTARERKEFWQDLGML